MNNDKDIDKIINNIHLTAVVKDTLGKYAKTELTQKTIDELSKELNEVINNYLAKHEVFESDFPIEIKDDVGMGRWIIYSNGNTCFYPKKGPIEINVTITSTRNMNNEKYNQIIDEAYTEYCKWYSHVDEKTGNLVNVKYPNSKSSKEEFIFRIKSDKEFAEVWGLTIEERVLSLEERVDIFNSKMIKEGIRTQIVTVNVSEEYWKELLEQTKHNIPTRAISITYNNETIEVYEN